MPGRKGVSTRTAILDRAADLASAEGLEGLTIGRLAAELELSKSGLFAHFGSKQDLQLATVHHAARRFYEAVVAPAGRHPEGKTRLQAYWRAYLDYLRSEVFAGGCFWAAAAAEFDDRPGRVRDAIRAGLAAWLEELERQARIADASDPAAVAFEIYSFGLGANAYVRLLGDETAFDRAGALIRSRLADLPADAPPHSVAAASMSPASFSAGRT
jgi:AcrR family transcriptional regulator